MNEYICTIQRHKISQVPKFSFPFSESIRNCHLCYFCRCDTHVKKIQRRKQAFQTPLHWSDFQSEDSKTTLSFLWMPFLTLWSTILPKYKQHKTFRVEGIASLYLKRNGERYSWIFRKVLCMTWLAKFIKYTFTFLYNHTIHTSYHITDVFMYNGPYNEESWS